jgi:hypothetical protein
MSCIFLQAREPLNCTLWSAVKFKSAQTKVAIPYSITNAVASAVMGDKSDNPAWE